MRGGCDGGGESSDRVVRSDYDGAKRSCASGCRHYARVIMSNFVEYLGCCGGASSVGDSAQVEFRLTAVVGRGFDVGAVAW